MTIVYADGVTELMEDRGVKAEDVAAVIEAAEANNDKLLSEETGNFLARVWLENVNVYVEYAFDGEQAEVKEVYAHMVGFADEMEG